MLSSLATPLALPALRALTRRVATEVDAGRHAVHIDPDRRWYRLLRSDDEVDVWLISWAHEQGAQLHDHGESVGALTVVSGRLVEHHWSGERFSERSLTAGHGAVFPRGHVHDVLNCDPTPAVSVHAYSPPLTSMSYYTVADDRLRRTNTESVEQGSSVGVG